MKAFLFDTETTDLITNPILRDEHQPRVIEFYGCLTDDSEAILDEVEFLCHPGIEIGEETTKITKITREDLKGKPPFKEYEGQVRGILGKAEAMVAHNLSFDWRVLQLEFERCGTLNQVPWPLIRICTVEQTEFYKGFRLKLGDLHKHLFGEVFEGAHRAKVDVMAMKRCYHELRRRGDL